MAFAEQFELLELLHRDKAETWVAIEKASNRRLLLHRFKEDTGLRERLLSMAPADLMMLVSAEKEGDSYLVATHDTPALRQFTKWVESRSESFDRRETSGATVRADETVAWDQTRSHSGSFEAWFVTPPVAPSNTPFGDTPTPARPAPSRSGDELHAQPGEFTRMFQTPNTDFWHTSSGSAESYRPVSSKGPEPGEFTRAFQSFDPHLAAPPTPPVPERPAPSLIRPEPGEFTRVFSSTRDQWSAQSPPSFPPQAPSKRVSDESGEFTRMFNNPLASTPESRAEYLPSAPVSLPEPPPAAPGEYTRMFHSHAEEHESAPGRSGATGIFSRPKSTPAPVSQPPMPAGPSDYTMVVRPSSPAPPSTAVAPPPAPSEPAPLTAATPKTEDKQPAAANNFNARNIVTLVVILAILAIVAVALLLYFFLRR